MISIRRLMVVGVLSAVALLTPSCPLTGFKEAAAVNLELRFYRWDSICITKPDTRENGFLPVLNAAEVTQEITQRQIPPGLAAVVVGTAYDEVQAARIAAEWKKRLGALGFQRVVVLRGVDGMKINGMPVIADFRDATADGAFGYVRTGSDTRLAP